MLYGIVNLALIYTFISILGSIWWIFSFVFNSEKFNLSEFQLRSGLIAWIAFLVFHSISFLLILNIRKLIHLFKKEEYFENAIVRCLKLISFLILSIVLMESSLQYFGYFHNAKYAIFQGWEYKSFLEKSMIIYQSEDLRLVFLAGIIYLVSAAFKRGLELKQLTSLTI